METKNPHPGGAGVSSVNLAGDTGTDTTASTITPVDRQLDRIANDLHLTLSRVRALARGIITAVEDASLAFPAAVESVGTIDAFADLILDQVEDASATAQQVELLGLTMRRENRHA